MGAQGIAPPFGDGYPRIGEKRFIPQDGPDGFGVRAGRVNHAVGQAPRHGDLTGKSRGKDGFVFFELAGIGFQHVLPSIAVLLA